MPGPVDITSSAATAYLRQFFTHVREAATLSNPYGIHNQEWDGQVYVSTGLRHPWAQLWPRLRLYARRHESHLLRQEARGSVGEQPAQPAQLRCPRFA